jgi:hypothetical protein
MGVAIMEAAGGLIAGQCEARGAGFWPKTQNQAIVARFQACHMKRRCRVVPGGNRCRWKSRRWQVGYVFANARPGGGFWAQKPETEHLWLGFGCAM